MNWDPEQTFGHILVPYHITFNNLFSTQIKVYWYNLFPTWLYSAIDITIETLPSKSLDLIRIYSLSLVNPSSFVKSLERYRGEGI